MKRNEVSKEYKIDLDQLYKSMDEFVHDCELVMERIAKIEKYKGIVTKSAVNLHDTLELTINTYVAIERINVYAHLLTSIDASDKIGKDAYAKVKNVITSFFSSTAFVDDEILKCDFETIKKYIDEKKDLQVYEYYLKRLFKKKKHILSEKEEIILSQMDITAGDIENNRSILLFEDLKFGKVKNNKGEYVEVTNQNYKKLLEEKDSKFRRQVFKKYYKAFADFQNIFTSLLNSKLEYDINYAKIRGYETPLAMSLSEYDLSEELITNYLAVANENNELCRKYNEIMKKALGLKKLHTYDLYYNPFPKSDKSYTVEEANNIILSSLNVYGDKYTTYLSKMFSENRIDYIPTDNKATGAFCISGYDINSYVFLNYQNKLSNISTLAHELGHAVHSMFLRDSNKPVNSDSSFLLVEIASTINEILLCEYVLQKSDDVYEKYEILKELLDTLLGNFFLVAGRLELQNEMYDRIASGNALNADFINEMELKVASKFESNGIELLDENKGLWMTVSHYYYLYYNYQYAIGIAIATLFASRILNGKENEVDNYLEFLKASGRNFPTDILKEYGVDLLDKAVFTDFIKYTSDKLNEFENIVKEVGVGVNE